MNASEKRREKFMANAEEFWEKINLGDSRKANATVRSNEKILASVIDDGGTVKEFLSPLLAHESAAVRYAAAANFMNFEKNEEAILVLRTLVKKDPSLIAISAGAVLRVHNIASA